MLASKIFTWFATSSWMDGHLNVDVGAVDWEIITQKPWAQGAE